jgi:hypothetical protein
VCVCVCVCVCACVCVSATTAAVVGDSHGLKKQNCRVAVGEAAEMGDSIVKSSKSEAAGEGAEAHAGSGVGDAAQMESGMVSVMPVPATYVASSSTTSFVADGRLSMSQ